MKILNKALSYIPTKLPTGMTEFDSWSDSIIKTYDFPENDSIKFTLATMILHADQSMAYAPKRYFALRVIKGMANQVASQAFQDIKTRQLEAQKQAEATASAVADEHQQQTI